MRNCQKKSLMWITGLAIANSSSLFFSLFLARRGCGSLLTFSRTFFSFSSAAFVDVLVNFKLKFDQLTTDFFLWPLIAKCQRNSWRWEIVKNNKKKLQSQVCNFKAHISNCVIGKKFMTKRKKIFKKVHATINHICMMSANSWSWRIRGYCEIGVFWGGKSAMNRSLR